MTRYKESAPRLESELFDVAPRFCRQCADIVNASADYETDSLLRERIHKACIYFEEKLSSLMGVLLIDAKTLESDNKKVAEQLSETLDNLRQLYGLKANLLRFVAQNGFAVSSYLKQKARFTLDGEMEKGEIPRTRKKVEKENKNKKSGVLAVRDATDISYPELFETLRRWRGEVAFRERKSAYMILSNAVLIAITNALPTNAAELKRLSGLGPAKVTRYGEDILTLVRDYVAENAD